MALGALAGFLQGSLVARLRIPPFIVTLGGMLLFQGSLLGITGGVSVTPPRTFLLVGQSYVPKGLGWGLAAAAALALGFLAARSTGATRWRYAFFAALSLGFTAVLNAYEGLPFPVLLVLVLAALLDRGRPPHALRPPPLRHRRQPRRGLLLGHRDRAPHRRASSP